MTPAGPQWALVICGLIGDVRIINVYVDGQLKVGATNRDKLDDPAGIAKAIGTCLDEALGGAEGIPFALYFTGKQKRMEALITELRNEGHQIKSANDQVYMLSAFSKIRTKH